MDGRGTIVVAFPEDFGSQLAVGGGETAGMA